MQLLERVKVVVRIKLTGITNVADDDVNRKLCCKWGLMIELVV